MRFSFKRALTLLSLIPNFSAASLTDIYFIPFISFRYIHCAYYNEKKKEKKAKCLNIQMPSSLWLLSKGSKNPLFNESFFFWGIEVMLCITLYC